MCYSSMTIVFLFQNNTLLSFLLNVLRNVLLHDNLVPRKSSSFRQTIENGEVLEAGSNTDERSRVVL